MKSRNPHLGITPSLSRVPSVVSRILSVGLALAALALGPSFARSIGPLSATSKPTAALPPASRKTPVPAALPSVSREAASEAPPSIDSVKVHKLYLDGDFDEAIAILEKSLKETRQYSHEDSVFIFKHLGVMYAAQYETREKGKYYMHRLLMVEPTAKIMDMYASDMIYMIFKNIQEEFEQNRMRLSAQDGGGPKTDTTHPPKPLPKESSSNGKAWIWTGAAVAVAAAGVGVYFVFFDEPKATTQSHTVGP